MSLSRHSSLALTTLAGDALTCGKRYGQRFETRIVGFCRQETRPDTDRLAFARRCIPVLETHAPTANALMRGIAEGAGISREHVILLSLHEELYPARNHCTAFAATGNATVNGKTLTAMNWDWEPHLWPWPGLLALALKGVPRTLTLHYPGLWAGAGLNEAGLGLTWTSAGDFPKRAALTEGVPTYALIGELLLRGSVQEALAYLEAVPLAGAFIFLLADASGAIAGVEGMPGHISVVRNAEMISRANHLECPDALSASGQQPEHVAPTTSPYRAARMAECLSAEYGAIDPTRARTILTDREGAWPWLHQYPAPTGGDAVSLRSMTIDSLVIDCNARMLHTCRGGRRPGPWQVRTIEEAAALPSQ